MNNEIITMWKGNNIFIFFLLFFVCGFLEAGGKPLSKVYVSSSIGDDNNLGTKPSPLKSIAKALTLSDTVLLRCNDVFYESVKLKKGKIFSYGRGKKPMICGWKRIKVPKWECAGENIWKISLAEENYTGVNVSGSSILNNIGCVHEYDKNLIHGRKVQYKCQLKEDWDIWQTEHHSNKDIIEHDFDSLYLMCSQNPNDLKIEFSIGTVGISAEECTIDNIRIEGFGQGGISSLTKTFIKNCEVDAIGGMTQITDREFVCLGNGIEFWMYRSIYDCIVEKCVVSRCYDAGMSMQGPRNCKARPHRVIFRKNVIADCCQGWEDFLNNDENLPYDNCYFENNIVINSGKTTGFNYPPRTKFCHVLGTNTRRKNRMIFRNNTFIGGNFFCAAACETAYQSNVWIDNECYICRGDYLVGDYMGVGEFIRIPIKKDSFKCIQEATSYAINRYKTLTADNTTIFHIKSKKYISRRCTKLKSKYIR